MAENENFQEGKPISGKESTKGVDSIPQELLNLDNLTEEVKELFTFIGKYKPRSLRLATTFKPFIPEYKCAVELTVPRNLCVQIPRPDGIDDGLGIRTLDEIGPQSNANELENRLLEFLEDDDTTELTPSPLPQTENIIPPVVTPPAISSIQNISDSKSELPHPEVEAPNLPPLVLKQPVSNPTKENVRSFVQTFVTNFLSQSLKEYLISSAPTLPPLNRIEPSSEKISSQSIPLYIQDMLQSVLQNYLITISKHANDPPLITTPSASSSSQSLVPLMSPKSSITPRQEREAPPLIEEKKEIVTAAITTPSDDDNHNHHQISQQIIQSYDEKIALYEEKLNEMQQNYQKLQKSSQETISGQSLKLLTMSEILEENSIEINLLRGQRENQIAAETEVRLQLQETIYLSKEELDSVRHLWKDEVMRLEREKSVLSDQVNDAQVDLTETIQYYQEKEKKAEEEAEAALARLPVLTDGTSQTDVDEIILQYETRITALVEENEQYLKGVSDHIKLKEEYERVMNENKEMRNALMLSQDNAHLLTLKLNASNYEINLQNEELTAVRSELNELKAAWSALHQEMNHLQANHRELQNKIAMDAESIQNMKGSKYKLQNTIKNLELENKLLHINYTALQSLECRSCHKPISQLYLEHHQHQQSIQQSQQPHTHLRQQQQPQRPQSRQKERKDEEGAVTNIGESAFDQLPDELSRTEEIGPSESRFLEDDAEVKALVNGSRMVAMNSSVLLKSNDKKHDLSPSRRIGSKSKSMNSLSKPTARLANTSRLKSPKLDAVVLPSTCAECLKRIKGESKFLPTALQNLDLNSRESVSPISSEFKELGFPAKKAYLENQVVKRDVFGHQPGQNCVFCSWRCAREWNQKHTPVLQKYLIDQLICIAQGSF